MCSLKAMKTHSYLLPLPALLGCFLFAGGALLGAGRLYAQQIPITWTDPERSLLEQSRGLRNLPDDQRPDATRQLALQIRQLPPGMNKMRLAFNLANLSTEGDFGAETLQEVATTLANALHDQFVPAGPDSTPAAPYLELATLVRYEHVQASLDEPQYARALAKLEADDQRRENADFTLTDLKGKTWTLKQLQGQTVESKLLTS